MGQGNDLILWLETHIKPNYDRSIVAAPTRSLKVEKYIQSH